MNLVPYTLTALSRQDIPDTPQNRNIVVGAVVTCTDSAGATVTMFDDADGTNGSTAKQTGVNGQVTVFVEPGEYTFTVNGRPNKVVVGNPKQVSSVASIDDLRLQAGRFNGQQISLSGYYTGSTKGGGVFVWDAASTAADDGVRYFAVAGVATGRWELISGQIISTMTVKIPSDYPTLQEAVDDIYGRIEATGGARIRLLIESGHVLTSGLYLITRDYGQFIIQSEDDIVLCNLPSNADLFRSWDQCSFPIIAAMFDMQGTGQNGFYAANNSKIMVAASGTGKSLGVKNAGSRNVMVYRGSWASIGGKAGEDTPYNYSGAGEDNIFCSRGSWCFANNSIITNAGQFGIHSRFSSHVVAYESDIRGSGNNNANCSSGGTIGLGSTLNDGINKLNPAPNTIGGGGLIIGGSSVSGAVNIIGRYGGLSEGIIEYSDGSRRFWKYIEVDSTASGTQLFTMPFPVPSNNARIYLSGASGNNTSPVVGSGLPERAPAAASVVFGAAGGGNLGVRVTQPSSATTNTIIGYMATVDINAMPNALPLP